MVGDLLHKPYDTTLMKGENTRLSCTTALKETVDWMFKPFSSTNQERSRYIVQGGRVVHYLQSRISILDGTDGRFDLLILNTELSDAGTYFCIDEGGMGEKASAQLTVIGESIFYNFWVTE